MHGACGMGNRSTYLRDDGVSQWVGFHHPAGAAITFDLTLYRTLTNMEYDSNLQQFVPLLPDPITIC